MARMMMMSLQNLEVRVGLIVGVGWAWRSGEGEVKVR